MICPDLVEEAAPSFSFVSQLDIDQIALFQTSLTAVGGRTEIIRSRCVAQIGAPALGGRSVAFTRHALRPSKPCGRGEETAIFRLRLRVAKGFKRRRAVGHPSLLFRLSRLQPCLRFQASDVVLFKKEQVMLRPVFSTLLVSATLRLSSLDSTVYLSSETKPKQSRHAVTPDADSLRSLDAPH